MRRYIDRHERIFVSSPCDHRRRFERRQSPLSFLEIMIASFLAVVLCVSAVSINAAERCPGASLAESQEDFKWKYDSVPIVAYGSVMAVQNNVAKFQIRCVLKGQLSLPSLDLPQLGEHTSPPLSSRRWTIHEFSSSRREQQERMPLLDGREELRRVSSNHENARCRQQNHVRLGQHGRNRDQRRHDEQVHERRM